MPSSDRQGEVGLTAAELFQLLWDELSGVLGTAATAALLRRAVKRAARSEPALSGLVIERKGLEYAFSLPPSWTSDRTATAPAQLGALVRGELRPLLAELTGPVVIQRLGRVPELARAGFGSEDHR
jgi:hypothetical protein